MQGSSACGITYYRAPRPGFLGGPHGPPRHTVVNKVGSSTLSTGRYPTTARGKVEKVTMTNGFKLPWREADLIDHLGKIVDPN